MIRLSRWWVGGRKESDKEYEALQALHELYSGFIRNKKETWKGEGTRMSFRKIWRHANLAGASLRAGRVYGAGEGRLQLWGRKARTLHGLAVVVDHLGPPLQHPVPHKVVGTGALQVAQVDLHLPHPVQRVQSLPVDASQFVPNESQLDEVGQPVKSPGQRC